MDFCAMHKRVEPPKSVSYLKANNVDISAYRNGSIVGNHCMYMGANGDKIMDTMKKAMLPKIKDSDNISYLNNTCARMKHILRLWYELMRTMKSAEYQKDEDCERFEENRIELNKAFNSLINDPPVPGYVLELSKQLKSHLLFDWEIRVFLLVWRTLGGVDEQRVEGTHPRFNQLARKFGNSRGAFRQKKVFEEFLFMNSTFIVESIEEMTEKTKRKRVRTKKR